MPFFFFNLKSNTQPNKTLYMLCVVCDVLKKSLRHQKKTYVTFLLCHFSTSFMFVRCAFSKQNKHSLKINNTTNNNTKKTQSTLFYTHTHASTDFATRCGAHATYSAIPGFYSMTVITNLAACKCSYFFVSFVFACALLCCVCVCVLQKQNATLETHI